MADAGRAVDPDDEALDILTQLIKCLNEEIRDEETRNPYCDEEFTTQIVWFCEVCRNHNRNPHSHILGKRHLDYRWDFPQLTVDGYDGATPLDKALNEARDQRKKEAPCAHCHGFKRHVPVIWADYLLVVRFVNTKGTLRLNFGGCLKYGQHKFHLLATVARDLEQKNPFVLRTANQVIGPGGMDLASQCGRRLRDEVAFFSRIE